LTAAVPRTRLILADGSGHPITTVTGDSSALSAGDAKRTATVIAELANQALEQAEMSGATISTLCAGIAGAGSDSAHKALTRGAQVG